MLELSDGYIVVSAQAVLQAAQNLPFVLQGLRIEDVNFQGKEADRHFRSGAAMLDCALEPSAPGKKTKFAFLPQAHKKRQREAARRQKVRRPSLAPLRTGDYAIRSSRARLPQHAPAVGDRAEAEEAPRSSRPKNTRVYRQLSRQQNSIPLYRIQIPDGLLSRRL